MKNRHKLMIRSWIIRMVMRLTGLKAIVIGVELRNDGSFVVPFEHLIANNKFDTRCGFTVEEFQ